MAIIRACSYNCSIKTPQAPSEYSEILVSFSQNQNTLINKALSDGDGGLDTTADAVQVHLSQEDTALFEAPGVAYMQIRCYKSTYDAPGSKLFQIPVIPALNDEILGGT